MTWNRLLNFNGIPDDSARLEHRLIGVTDTRRQRAPPPPRANTRSATIALLLIKSDTAVSAAARNRKLTTARVENYGNSPSVIAGGSTLPPSCVHVVPRWIFNAAPLNTCSGYLLCPTTSHIFLQVYSCLNVRGLLSSVIKRISLFVLGIQRLDERLSRDTVVGERVQVFGQNRNLLKLLSD